MKIPRNRCAFIVAVIATCSFLLATSHQTQAQSDEAPPVLFDVKASESYDSPAGHSGGTTDIGFGPTISYSIDGDGALGSHTHAAANGTSGTELKIERSQSQSFFASGLYFRSWTTNMNVTVWVRTDLYATTKVILGGELEVDARSTPPNVGAGMQATASSSVDFIQTKETIGAAGKSYSKEYSDFVPLSVRTFEAYPGVEYVELIKPYVSTNLDHAFLTGGAQLYGLASVTMTIRVCPDGGCELPRPVWVNPVAINRGAVCDKLGCIPIRPGQVGTGHRFSSSSGRVQDLIDAGIEFYEVVEPMGLSIEGDGSAKFPKPFECKFLPPLRKKQFVWTPIHFLPLSENLAQFADQHSPDCENYFLPPETVPGSYDLKQQIYYKLPYVNNNEPVLFAEYVIRKGVSHTTSPYEPPAWVFYVHSNNVRSRNKFMFYDIVSPPSPR